MIKAEYYDNGLCHVEFSGDTYVIAVELVDLARKIAEQEPEIISMAIELVERMNEDAD